MRLPVLGIARICSAVAVLRLIFLIAVASLLLVGATVGLTGAAVGSVAGAMVGTAGAVDGALVGCATAAVVGTAVGTLPGWLAPHAATPLTMRTPEANNTL